MRRPFPHILPEATMHTFDKLHGIVFTEASVSTTALSMITLARTFSAQQNVHRAAVGGNGPCFGHGLSNSFGNDAGKTKSTTVSKNFRKLEGAHHVDNLLVLPIIATARPLPSNTAPSSNTLAQDRSIRSIEEMCRSTLSLFSVLSFRLIRCHPYKEEKHKRVDSQSSVLQNQQ